MSRLVANVDINTETFATWVIRTNTVLDALSNEIITANATFANTGSIDVPRNAQLIGTFGANTLIATGAIRGGNTSISANLNITSNTIVSGNTFTSSSNSLYTNTQFFTANIQANGALLNVLGTTMDVSSNVNIRAANISLGSNLTITAIKVSGNSTSTNTQIAGNTLYISSNNIWTGSSHSLAGNTTFNITTLKVDALNNRVGIGTATPDTTLQVLGTANVSGATYIGGAATVANTLQAGNTTVTGFITISTAATVGTLGVAGAATVTNTLQAGNTTVTGFINASGSGTFANLNVNTVSTLTGNTTVGGTLAVTGNTTFNTDYVVAVEANSNIGVSGIPSRVFSFPKAAYRSGKIMVLASNAGKNQMSEMVVAHDGINAYVSVYGVISSPHDEANTTSPLGTFTAIINTITTNVDILMDQTTQNTAVKVVAHLIK